MSPRRWLALLCGASALALAACGAGGDGFGCTGHTCVASFQGPGEQDLSSKLGQGATVRIDTIDDRSVTGQIAGEDAKLVTGEPQRVAGYQVTLTDVDGDDVKLRVVGD